MLKRRILIVASDHDTRKALRLAFQHADFAVSAAASEKTALGSLTSPAPDIIVTDLLMPLVRGEDFIRFLKTQPQLSATPIVVLTAHLHAFGQAARAAGAAETLDKSSDLSAVVATVKRLLGDSDD